MHEGIDLKEVPEIAGGAEQTMAGGDSGAAFDMSSVDKPWVENEQVAKYGQKVYQANCAVCHGKSGMGDGAAGAALNPPPRDLVEGKWTVGGTSEELFTTITKGIDGTSMAAFGHIELADRWAIVQYVRSITKNKGKDNASKLEAFASAAK